MNRLALDLLSRLYKSTEESLSRWFHSA